ncbi:MAG: ketoacyl-ACP synthase III [Flammeovirgaceae bacterium]
MTNINAVIKGVGAYLPEYILSNKELEKIVDTNDAWIMERTGIRERRILKGEGLGTSYMAVRAVKQLLEKTNTDPKEIDLVICATVTPDMVFPATANLVATEVGAINAYSFDISAACSGFIYALNTGAQFIKSGAHKKVIIIGADKMSSIIDYQDRATCVIFGDGAGAVLLEPTTEDVGIKEFYFRSDGQGAQFLNMPAGGSAKPATHSTVDAREHFVKQEGKTVFKFAVTNMADAAVKVMEMSNLQGKDIAFLVPHQANKRIIDATAQRMGVSEDKVMLNIERYGNTTAGTIPLCLFDYEKQLKKGDHIILAAFGGGFTWGAMHVVWGY